MGIRTCKPIRILIDMVSATIVLWTKSPFCSKEDVGSLWEGIKEGLNPDILKQILRNFTYTYIYTLLIAMLTSWVDRHFLSVLLTKPTEIPPPLSLPE